MTDEAPITANRTLRRLPNAAYRQREYLAEAEVERLIEAARRQGRNGPRDAAAILLAYRHGLRAQELCSLRWAQIDLKRGRLHVNRAKGGIESVHPLHGPELRALRPLQDKSPKQPRPQQRVGSCACCNEQGRGCKAPVCCSPSHASTRVRLQTRQRWARHSIPCSLLGSSQSAIDRKVHGASRREICAILERLTRELKWARPKLASRQSGPTTTGRAALPGHGDGNLTTFAELLGNRCNDSRCYCL
jgi:hypothetical protein